MKFNVDQLIRPEFGADAFEKAAIDVFKYQFACNRVYHQYCTMLGITPELVNTIEDIPFLPIEFFKKYRIVTGASPSEAVFRSSTTTGQVPSQHHIHSLGLYESSFLKGFEFFYGNPGDYCIIGLLPSYLERVDSSLVYMVDRFIRISGHSHGGFYLYNYGELAETLKKLTDKETPVLIFGVTFALLDLAEKYPMELSSSIIIETGGMKGRRKELIRPELQKILKEALQPKRIDSEYGMTELLSQAYKIGEADFRPVPWMKVFAKEINNPLGPFTHKAGLLHIIDLANVYSCSFIATKDLGIVNPDGSFDVLGRYDHAEARGCNLMVV